MYFILDLQPLHCCISKHSSYEFYLEDELLCHFEFKTWHTTRGSDPHCRISDNLMPLSDMVLQKGEDEVALSEAKALDITTEASSEADGD